MAKITIDIPDNVLDEFRDGFLAAEPIFVDKDKNPTMTEMEWLVFWIKRQLRGAYRRGKEIRHAETFTFNKEILSEKAPE